MRHQSWLPSLPPPGEWMDQAACKDSDPDLFFTEGNTARHYRDQRHARLICAVCPVSAECLAAALEHDERFGIWGGLSAADRQGMKRGSA